MERPILTLTTKDFLSGLAMLGAHAARAGLFYSAPGVTPLFEAGKAQSTLNGLLTPGAAGTVVSGSLTGSVIASITDTGIYNTTGAIFSTDDSKLWKLLFSAGAPSGSISSPHTVGHTLTPGLVCFNAGSNYLFYRQIDQIGRLDPSGPTYNDAWQAASTDYFGAMHQYFDTVLFGNGPGKIGSIDSSLAVVLSALDFDSNSFCSAISDDGVYAVFAITRNSSADETYLAGCTILFWDGNASSWLRDYDIPDPLIYALKKTPLGVFAYGITGIWQVTFDGVKKIFSHPPGVYTKSGSSTIHYGQGATSFFSDAILWGGQVGSLTSRAVKSFGKLDAGALSAYLHPILGTVSKNITSVDGQLLKGYVFVGDDTPQLTYYPLGSGTQQTGVSAQTIYFPLSTKATIRRIEVVLGKPLSSGDAFDIDTKIDENTSAANFDGSKTFTNLGAVRRVVCIPDMPVQVDEQISLIINFTGGAVAIKRIEVFADWNATTQ